MFSVTRISRVSLFLLFVFLFFLFLSLSLSVKSEFHTQLSEEPARYSADEKICIRGQHTRFVSYKHIFQKKRTYDWISRKDDRSRSHLTSSGIPAITLQLAHDGIMISRTFSIISP